MPTAPTASAHDMRVGDVWRRAITHNDGTITTIEGPINEIDSNDRNIRIGQTWMTIGTIPTDVREVVWELISRTKPPRPEGSAWLPDPDTGEPRYEIMLAGRWREVIGYSLAYDRVVVFRDSIVADVGSRTIHDDNWRPA